MVEVSCITIGAFDTNCYIIKQNNKAILIDAMVDQQGSIEAIEKELEDLDLLAVVLTHGHYDHIAGLNLLFERYQMPIYIHRKEAHYLSDPKMNLSSQITEPLRIDLPFYTIDSKQITIDTFQFEIIKTPGHTPGSITLVLKNHAFVGDFLFKNSIGRIDLIGGNRQEMNGSLKKAITWPEDWIIYPGHGQQSKMIYEKKSNPYLRNHR